MAKTIALHAAAFLLTPLVAACFLGVAGLLAYGAQRVGVPFAVGVSVGCLLIPLFFFWLAHRLKTATGRNFYWTFALALVLAALLSLAPVY